MIKLLQIYLHVHILILINDVFFFLFWRRDIKQGLLLREKIKTHAKKCECTSSSSSKFTVNKFIHFLIKYCKKLNNTASRCVLFFKQCLSRKHS